MRTIEGAKFQVGEHVWNVIFKEEVEILEIDVRQHGDDDYYIKWIKSGIENWAEESDLEKLK